MDKVRIVEGNAITQKEDLIVQDGFHHWLDMLVGQEPKTGWRFMGIGLSGGETLYEDTTLKSPMSGREYISEPQLLSYNTMRWRRRISGNVCVGNYKEVGMFTESGTGVMLDRTAIDYIKYDSGNVILDVYLNVRRFKEPKYVPYIICVVPESQYIVPTGPARWIARTSGIIYVFSTYQMPISFNTWIVYWESLDDGFSWSDKKGLIQLLTRTSGLRPTVAVCDDYVPSVYQSNNILLMACDTDAPFIGVRTFFARRTTSYSEPKSNYLYVEQQAMFFTDSTTVPWQYAPNPWWNVLENVCYDYVNHRWYGAHVILASGGYQLKGGYIYKESGSWVIDVDVSLNQTPTFTAMQAVPARLSGDTSVLLYQSTGQYEEYKSNATYIDTTLNATFGHHLSECLSFVGMSGEIHGVWKKVLFWNVADPNPTWNDAYFDVLKYGFRNMSGVWSSTSVYLDGVSGEYVTKEVTATAYRGNIHTFHARARKAGSIFEYTGNVYTANIRPGIMDPLIPEMCTSTALSPWSLTTPEYSTDNHIDLAWAEHSAGIMTLMYKRVV